MITEWTFIWLGVLLIIVLIGVAMHEADQNKRIKMLEEKVKQLESR